MEIQGSDGSKTQLKPNSTTVFGRSNQFNTKDLSISRRHISFDIISSPSSPDCQTSPRVSFEVLGKNPIWVYNKNGDRKVKMFKRFQRGELGIDDTFCVSGKSPVWFTLKKVEDEVFDDKVGKSLEIGEGIHAELSQSLENDAGFDDNGDYGLDSVDVSNIDPVQEFGFLVIGHEFDQYPKKMIRQIKSWDWFLEDPVGDSDDDETSQRKGKKGGKRKRKKTRGDGDAVDEEWTAESEGEELTTHPSKVQRPKYHTRSKDQGLSGKRTNRKTPTGTSRRGEEEEYESEDDETLGGFIVNDETLEEDEEKEVDEDDEEEFVEDEELEE